MVVSVAVAVAVAGGGGNGRAVPRRTALAVRAVLRASFAMGLAASAFSLVVVSMIKPVDQQKQGGCVVTLAEAMDLRFAAVELLLSGVAQAASALLAGVLVEAMGAVPLAAGAASVMGLMTFVQLHGVVPGVVAFITGRCVLGWYLACLCILADVQFGGLVLVGFAIAFLSEPADG